MRVIGTILADLERSPIGTRSRLAEPLAGVPVLRRTVERTLGFEGLAGVHVLCSPGQRPQVQMLLEGLPAVVHGADVPPAPSGPLVTAARRWALHNWRGGIGGACAFDEDFHAAALHALAQACGADGVMAVPAHAPLLAAPLAGQILAQFSKVGEDYRFVFTQAPPGMAPICLVTPLLEELARTGGAPGMLLAYRPQAPEPDLVGKPCCWQAPTAVACASGRLLADTAESFATCEAAIAELGEESSTDAAALAKWLTARRRQHVADLPAEVEIELTTEDALPRTRMRPRGSRVPPRGPMDADLFARIAGQVAQRDDALLVLGGAGDPLRHPAWREMVRAARSAGVFGISVQTSGKQLAQTGVDAVMADPPDLLVVWLDAATADVYERVQGEGGFEEAAQALLAVEQARRERRQLRPLVVPAFTKSQANVAEMEAFFDRWIAAVGACHVEGYSHRGEQIERLEVAPMTPPARMPCRRLRSRLMVLADGRAVSCDQDFVGRQVAGDLRSQSLQQVWQGPALRRLREFCPSGSAPEPDEPVLCRACDEWGRP